MQFRRTLVAATVLALPLLSAEAQDRRRSPRPAGEAPPVSATELLNRRRELDLSPRQVARLDSIERTQYAERRSFMDQMQKQRDSVCAGRNPCRLSSEEREAFRNRLNGTGTNSFRRADSLNRSLAYSVLDSTQRGRVQGWRQGQRRAMMTPGRMGMGPQGPRGGMGRGWREEGRRPRGRQFDGPRGFNRGRDRDFGPRMRRQMERDSRGPGFDGPRPRRPRGEEPEGQASARPDTLQ